MFCSKCGACMDDGAVFCSKCGTKVIGNGEMGGGSQPKEGSAVNANSISTGGLNESVFFVLADLSDPIQIAYELVKDGKLNTLRFDHLYNSFSLDIKDNIKKTNEFFTGNEGVFWPGLMGGIGEHFEMYPNIPVKRLSIAKSLFTSMGADETPLLLYGKREPFLVTDKHLYARNKDGENFRWDLRVALSFRLEKALAVCTYLVFNKEFKIQVVPSKKNETAFEMLLTIVLSTVHLLRHIKGHDARFIDALNKLRKMPLSSREKAMDDPSERRKWANWIDFCYDETADVQRW